MPIPLPVATIPFDLVDTAMNYSRVYLDDCPLGLSGNLLADTQPYAQTFYNLGWREFQKDLAQAGDPAQTVETIIAGVTPVANIDPATQVYLNQAYYFDGQNFFSTPDVTLLPQDLICPLRLKERMANTQQLFQPMWPCDNGIPLCPKTTTLRYWEWRSSGPGNGNAIYMPGATISRDIWMRYASFLPDATDNTPLPATPWYQQPIPMMRCADTLAFYISAKYAFSRGSEQANAVGNSFMAQGKDGMRSLLNATTMKIRQRINHRRRPYSANRHQGWNY